MSVRHLLLAVSVLTFGAACGSDFEAAAPDPEDGGSEASGGSGTGGSGANGGSGASGGSGGVDAGGSGGSAGAAPVCPSTHRCIPKAPDGWQGPIANSFDAACAGAWPSEALVVHADLNADSATCECKCTAKANCPTSVSFVASSTSGCSFAASGTALPVGTCKTATSLPTNGIKLAAATPGCTSSVAETIPATSWATSHHLCGGASPGGECADPNEVCLPNPTVALCVYTQGQATCPAGFTDKHSYFTSVTDTRDCPATCTCTPGGTAQCQSTLTLYSSSNCSGTSTNSTLYSGGAAVCFGVSAKAGSITATQNGTCTPQAVSPTGGAEPAGEITVCCVP